VDGVVEGEGRQRLPVECKQAPKASLRRKGYCNIISSVVLKIENQ